MYYGLWKGLIPEEAWWRNNKPQSPSHQTLHPHSSFSITVISLRYSNTSILQKVDSTYSPSFHFLSTLNSIKHLILTFQFIRMLRFGKNDVESFTLFLFKKYGLRVRIWHSKWRTGLFCAQSTTRFLAYRPQYCFSLPFSIVDSKNDMGIRL